jgi:diguanylate cyclase (GGDEF)-like protein
MGAALVGVVILGIFVGRGEHRRIRNALRRRSREQLESSVKRALSMVDTEEEAVGVLIRAGRERTGGALTAMLSDSSRAHFHRTGDEAPSCAVESPVACPAARQGQTLQFASSDNLDACPHLRPGESSACGAICVPMAVEGTTIGVLHHQTAADDVDYGLAADLELIAGEASHRIGLVRSLRVSRTQASTDPLTGLPNRRHLEERLRSLQSARVQIALAFADLDHFKMLNDRHGHETGDRALSLFAAACGDALRKDDFVARIGGEEFVIVLPGCDEEAAAEILDRLRAGLADACAVAAFPRFTCSFGLAIAEPQESIAGVLRRADSALLQAKHDGRDRVVLAGEMVDEAEPPIATADAIATASAVLESATKGR